MSEQLRQEIAQLRQEIGHLHSAVKQLHAIQYTLAQGAGQIHHVGGYVMGHAKGGTPYLLLYPKADRLEHKICKVYPEQWRGLPDYLPRPADVRDDSPENPPSKPDAQRLGIYHECRPFTVITYDGPASALGPTKKLGATLFEWSGGQAQAQSRPQQDPAPQQPAQRQPEPPPAPPAEDREPPPEAELWDTAAQDTLIPAGDPPIGQAPEAQLLKIDNLAITIYDSLAEWRIAMPEVVRHYTQGRRQDLAMVTIGEAEKILQGMKRAAELEAEAQKAAGGKEAWRGRRAAAVLWATDTATEQPPILTEDEANRIRRHLKIETENEARQ